MQLQLEHERPAALSSLFSARLSPLSPVSHPYSPSNPTIEVDARLIAMGDTKIINPTFKALSCDTVPHFATIANFVGAYVKAIENIFEQVLLVCPEEGLLGKAFTESTSRVG